MWIHVDLDSASPVHEPGRAGKKEKERNERHRKLGETIGPEKVAFASITKGCGVHAM
jgi:hypothetical protein